MTERVHRRIRRTCVNGIGCGDYCRDNKRTCGIQAGKQPRTDTILDQIMENSQIRVGIIMGSQSDWPTMEHASQVLTEFGIRHENRVVSAHRTPQWLFQYAGEAVDRGLEIIIAGAGGAAHLPGMVASMTTLPVLGVPIKSRTLSGMDSLLSIVQMPGGVPVGTLAIGDAGAKNAGLLAVRILANGNPELVEKLNQFQKEQEQKVLENSEL